MATIEPDATANSLTLDRAWGPWQTTGLGLVILVAFLVAHMVAAAAYLLVLAFLHPDTDMQALADNALGNGTLLSVTIVFGSLIGCAFCGLFSWLRNRGGVRAYLRLAPVPTRTLLICLGAVAVFIVISDLMTTALGKPIVPEYMIDAYRSVVFTPLLWFAVCLAAPAFEELFFRGFLIRGWEGSRIGPVGAVVLSSAIWTGIHFQYGAYELAQIFVLGLLFGGMRVITGSVVPALSCHIFTNLVATIEAAIVSGLPGAA